MKRNTRLYKEWRRPRKVYESESTIDKRIIDDIALMKRATRSIAVRLY